VNAGVLEECSASEKLISTDKTAQCHNSEDHNLKRFSVFALSFYTDEDHSVALQVHNIS
jgi:hypothetical protein